MTMAPAALRLLLVLVVIGCCAAADERVDLWPMPKTVSQGEKMLYVARDLKMTTAGSNYSDGRAILKDAFQRIVAVIELDHVINGSYQGLPVLTGVNVVVHSPDDELNFGVDESYKLSVPETGNPLYAQIEAQTVFGALHALETFSQLCNFDFSLRLIELHSAPWTIMDMPRFPYRGLLIDTSRHYLPVPVIKSVIDSMTYSKLNVLHWHIVDEQSFPIEIPSYPKLWNGAYSYSERYTMDDAVDIVQHCSGGAWCWCWWRCPVLVEAEGREAAPGRGRDQVEGPKGVGTERLAATLLWGEVEGRGGRKKGPKASAMSSLRRAVRRNRTREEEEGTEGVGPELAAARGEEGNESVVTLTNPKATARCGARRRGGRESSLRRAVKRGTSCDAW